MPYFSQVEGSGQTLRSGYDCKDRRGVPPALVCVLAILFMPDAQAQRDGVSDALAGHQAEQRQLSGADPMRRAFFFDPVDIEGPNPGVPCDHVARRRPDAVAGQGAVVLLEATAPGSRRLRFWIEPGTGQSGNALAAATAYANSIDFGAFRLLGVREFAWCR